jgi:hypothetical protein
MCDVSQALRPFVEQVVGRSKVTLETQHQPPLFAVAFVLFFAVLLCDAQQAPAQFKQLGPKLVGTGNVGNALQGFSVALSADGNTGAGAAWVFTRSSGT